MTNETESWANINLVVPKVSNALLYLLLKGRLFPFQYIVDKTSHVYAVLGPDLSNSLTFD